MAQSMVRLPLPNLSPCDSEWAVICATHNLLKLYRSGKVNWN